jgi:hypothetical protein
MTHQKRFVPFDAQVVDVGAGGPVRSVEEDVEGQDGADALPHCLLVLPAGSR